MLHQFVLQITDRFRILRPDITLDAHPVSAADSRISGIEGLSQTLLNLMNNAADASLEAGRHSIALEVDVIAGSLRIDIADDGNGFSHAARTIAGQAVFSDKPDGSGYGLMLAHTTLSSWQGTLILHNRQEGGTLTRVCVPLSALEPQP